MKTQTEKGTIFRALHEHAHAFVIPNPWDAGTARLLAHLGFKALATTSAGHAFSLGQQDNTIGREETMAHCADIVAATDLPVSADLGNGFGDTPEIVAETIRLAAAAGLVGCSIEDASYQPANPIYPIELAIERIQAAAEAVRKFNFPFMLTARAENHLVGRYDLDDTIKRLQARSRCALRAVAHEQGGNCHCHQFRRPPRERPDGSARSKQRCRAFRPESQTHQHRQRPFPRRLRSLYSRRRRNFTTRHLYVHQRSREFSRHQHNARTKITVAQSCRGCDSLCASQRLNIAQSSLSLVSLYWQSAE